MNLPHSFPISLTRPLQFLPRTARNKASPLKARQMHFTRESGSRVTRIKVLLHVREAGGDERERRKREASEREGGKKVVERDDWSDNAVAHTVLR